MRSLLLWSFLIQFNFFNVLGGEDFYQLLGISRTADNREIRKAFKQLALKLHPDKNDAPDAHDKFLELNKAYDTLKDEQKRKKYDLYGEEGLGSSTGSQTKYQSWSYYRDDFGIYDDDPNIITLDSQQFQSSVMESHDIWFINFYSPRCGHCHDLAPTWRKLAKVLQGVIRVGAVNCGEERWLCQRQGINGYPSLVLYTLQGSVKYNGNRNKQEILTFLASHLDDPVIDIWEGNFNKWINSESTKNKPWLFIFCSQEECPPRETRTLLGVSLQGLVNIGLVDCNQDKMVCSRLRGTREANILFFKENELESSTGIELDVDISDHLEISRAVLHLLPGPSELTAKSLQELSLRLEKDIGPAWIILFTKQGEGKLLEYSKLTYLVPRLKFGYIDCAIEIQVCRSYFVDKFPTFVVAKLGGGYEVHYGRNSVQDVATFARLASQARTMRTLTAEDFPEILQDNSHVFVDFFAPWCPPCMKMLPEFRKASNLIGGSIIFGTVDCTLHRQLCNKYNIRGYPTTIFFNNSKEHEYSGHHNSEALASFVHDIVRPVVVTLDSNNFNRILGDKKENEMWAVEFYAPWCAPCRQLQPVWSQLARNFDKYQHLKFAKVNCEEDSSLCRSQHINSYPTIRIFTLGSQGSQNYVVYTGNQRDITTLSQWIQQKLPSYVINLTPNAFDNQVLSTVTPWLILYSSPRCGPCVELEPTYHQVAYLLTDRVKVGKVSCDRYVELCRREGITGYPHIRLYRGSDQYLEKHFYQDINTRERDEIIQTVKLKLEHFKTEAESKNIIGEEESENSVHDEL